MEEIKSARHERVEKILADITGILERATPQAVEKLKAFVTIAPKPHQAFATLEMFSDQNYCVTYNEFYIKEENGKKALDVKWDVKDSSAEPFVTELDEYAAKTFDNVDYSDAEQADFAPRQSKMLFEWFAKCWKEAGGEHAKTPTFFAMNKEYMCQDLTTGEMATEEETARRLGYDVAVV